MERQLTLHPRASYTVILGFIAGSILSVFPYVLPVGIQWLICPVLFALAFILMFMLSKLEK
jgi:putative membrane protein